MSTQARSAAPSEEGPPVACVLVTWNKWAHTERCLRTLSQQQYLRLTIIVVDNGSTDETLQRLRDSYPSVLCLENAYSTGFAKACNRGARLALERGAAYLWFLNNDTEVPPETLSRLVSKAQADSKVGIVGGVLRYLHHPEKVQAWGGGWINLLSGYNRHVTQPEVLGKNFYITFASALVRRRAFRDLGGLWEEIFMYFEDSDFSLRARNAGWQLAVAADTSILHAEGASTASGPRKSPFLQQVQTKSGVLFLRRHGSIPVLPSLLFLALRLGKRIGQRDWAGVRAVLRGAAEGWRVPRSAICRRA